MPCAIPCGASYPEIWKIANEALAYPNAELVRKALRAGPAERQHCAGSARAFRSRSVAGPFHQDECGLSSPTWWTSMGIEGADLKAGPPGIRRTGERSCPVRYFVGRGAQHTSGRVQALTEVHRRRHAWSTSRRGRRSCGRPALSGDSRRRSRRCRYHQAQRAGFHRPRHPGKGERGHRGGTGRRAGRGGELLAAGGRRQVDGEVAAGGLIRQDGEAQGLPGLRHQRRRSSTWPASRAIRSWSPSTRIRRRRSSRWRMSGSSTTSWSSCRS